LREIISRQPGKFILFIRLEKQEWVKNNSDVVNSANLEETINRLWNENLLLKLNLSRSHLLLFDEQINVHPDDLAQVNKLRQIQRRIRIQKLHSMRIPKIHLKATPRNGILSKKNHNGCSALAEEVECMMKFRKIHQNESNENGQLASRIYLKKTQDEKKKEYTIKKLIIGSESTFYRRLLF
jgi:hypothetical protein